MNRYVVIMAGGKGERFWPVSRLSRPKHLLPIVGDKPMLRQTVDRLEGLVPAEHVIIVTNKEQEAAIREICPDLPAENIVSEPVGRDTAPAVGLAALLVKKRDPEAIFAMLPADHVIHDVEGFQKVMDSGFELAEAGEVLITIGIAPTHPATGYGYIHKGEMKGSSSQTPAYKVQKFVEKPDTETAQQYLDSGEYYWNAGMFIWSVHSIYKSIEQFNPGLFASLNEIESLTHSGTSLENALADIYPTLEKISIDYSVMEKADNVETIESNFDWDDVGEWPAIERHSDKDEAGNLLSGLGLVSNCSNNIIYNDGERVTAIYGVDELIVVHTADATLICPKSKAQEIKKLVKQLGADARFESFL